MSSDMEKFILGFLSLDRNKDGMVDRGELLSLCRQKNLDSRSVDKWMEKFDENKDGKISMEEFCRGFGLKVDEMRIEKESIQKAEAGNAPKVAHDITVIASTMPPDKEYTITEKYKEIIKKEGDGDAAMRNAATKLKVFLDETYGRVWQVIILNGSYWMNFSHEPFQSLQFKHEAKVCLLWRTPGQ